LFGLNICAMQIESEQQFNEVRQYIVKLHKRLPMFRHDIANIDKMIEEHIKRHSIALIYYRQTHKKRHLEESQKEIEEINRILTTIGKMELMALLSQG